MGDYRRISHCHCTWSANSHGLSSLHEPIWLHWSICDLCWLTSPFLAMKKTSHISFIMVAEWSSPLNGLYNVYISIMYIYIYHIIFYTHTHCAIYVYVEMSMYTHTYIYISWNPFSLAVQSHLYSACIYTYEHWHIMTIHFSFLKSRTPPFAPHIEWCPQIARGEVNP